MMLSLFDQFMSPTLLGIPLMALAIAFPSILILTMSPRWLNNRMLVLQNWFINLATRQLFLPVNVAGHKWALMFMSLMIFLISLNTLGLLPYTFTPTTQLSLTLSLAVPLWLMTVITGMRHKTTHSLAHLLPEGTPIPLIPALIIIETISLLIRPFALAVRIAANLTAGHLLIHLISTAAMVLLPMSTMLTLSMMVLLYLLTFLEMAVAMLQAFVFVLLLTLYLQENI